MSHLDTRGGEMTTLQLVEHSHEGKDWVLVICVSHYTGKVDIGDLE